LFIPSFISSLSDLIIFLSFFVTIDPITCLLASLIHSRSNCFISTRWLEVQCHNLSFGLATKAREWKDVVSSAIQKSHSHLWECIKSEGMKSHTPKWIPILQVEVLMDFQIFKEHFVRSKFIELKTFLYHWKTFKT